MSYFWHVFLFPQANCFYSLLFRKIRVTLCVHAKSLQVCSTLQLYGLQPTRLCCPWDSPGEDPGVGCHALLQGNLPDPGINPCPSCLVLWREDSLPLVPPAWVLSRFSRVRLFATLWTVASQASLSMAFCRQEYWSGLPFLSPGR